MENIQHRFGAYVKLHWKTIIFLVVVLITIGLANQYVDSYIRRLLNLCAIYTIISLGMNLV
ncbi:MAG: branched-chain amino acid ABC transporter permease, partial [Eubacteriaceae bacterium]|nr:branched-chain amino acid ABC transporter permease [Eubacteriaceae bacterium]